MMKRLLVIAALLCGLQTVRAMDGVVFVEAESFASKGGWSVDQQFMDLMGSPYLLAHGMGVPVEDAVTRIDIPCDGVWTVWVRTYNWTSPWTSEAGPGAFKVRVGCKTLKTKLGTTGDCWMWQNVGSLKLKAGETELALCDMTGFDGRCDAICLTLDKDPVLPAGGDELDAFRRESIGLGEPQVQSGYDMVVVGGGIAGMCAAVSAARLGCKVALVNDRPVLGGNNSAEVRVHLGGHIELGPNKGLGRMIREFGHTKAGNAQPASNYEDKRKQEFIDAEENVSLYAPYHAVQVRMDGNRIAAVLVRHIETAEEIWLEAPLFSDCTGDGTLGYLAGADFLMGREAASEYGESLAPEVADKMTMGASVQWYSRKTEKPSSFPEFSYGVEFNEGNCEKVRMGEWQWETGMNFDQIHDAERIRDYGLLVVYSNWSFLKNQYSKKADYANRELDWVAYIAGKRESRRLLGDYVLKQDDIDKNVFHEDGSFTSSWSIDLHFPDPKNTEKFPGAEFKAATVHNWIYPCTVPYRCLYSRNIDNLFMAGRNISVTHVALGTVRVMRTTGMMGEVVGMAASLCKANGCLPRQVYQHHLPELKELMRQGVGKYEGLNDQTFNRANRLLDAPKVHE
ncbi:MAG: FAD-dependent oxidoreductase [Candidatus Cryptobacteroides sp.]